MSILTKIQWADSTVNPMMGCDGCELWPTIPQLVNVIAEAVEHLHEKPKIKDSLRGLLPTDVYHRRAEIARMFSTSSDHSETERIEKAIKTSFPCYAGQLHLFRGVDDTNPGKKTNPGYARKFDEPKLFPGRTMAAAAWKDLTGQDRLDAPWKNALPRLIFVSDMGDALSRDVSFEYLLSEIILAASSPNGQRHIWMWLTKRPRRMAEFSDRLIAKNIKWPDNLVAMTSVTSSRTVGRVAELQKVRCTFRGLSVEPLWTSVQLPLQGINHVIVGGESGTGAKPFQIEWARDIIRQCRQSGAAPFVKQLGAKPFDGNHRLHLHDSHGGDWNEWPSDLRVREFPPFNAVISPT